MHQSRVDSRALEDWVAWVLEGLVEVSIAGLLELVLDFGGEFWLWRRSLRRSGLERDVTGKYGPRLRV